MRFEKPPTLLVVDDDPDLRMLLEMTLSASVPRVFSAADGDKALELALEERPSVVVLDVMLPGSLDGLALCRRIKTELPACFVVIVSGRSLESDLLDAERAGADAYFVKPVSLLELGRLIESVFERGCSTRAKPGLTGRPRSHLMLG